MSYKLQLEFFFFSYFSYMNIDIGEKCVTMNKEEQDKYDVVRVKSLQFAKPICGLFLFSFFFLTKK